MKAKTILCVLLIVGLLFLVGCSSNDYNKPPSQPSGGYVGGGCGVKGISYDTEPVVDDSTSLATAF